MQAALLGLVGLLLAFGLSLAVSRYEDRRANVVDEANAIGTTYLRAQTLAEPVRSRSLDLLVGYTRSAIRVSDEVPGSAEARDARAQEERIERRLWSLAGEALDTAPTASAPRLYVETLNEMIDGETARVAGLSNRVPTAVLALEVVGAALAIGLLAAYLAIVGRGVVAVTLAAALVGISSARHGGPRSPDARNDHRPRHRAEGPARVDAGTARRRRTWVSTALTNAATVTGP